MAVTDLLRDHVTLLLTILMVFVWTFPPSAPGTELYGLTITMPISASVFALQKESEKARDVLWGAAKLDPERTLEKLATDPHYRRLKQDGSFYSAASPVGLLYKHYCLKPGDHKARCL